jgi:hypothetical protein
LRNDVPKGRTGLVGSRCINAVCDNNAACDVCEYSIWEKSLQYVQRKYKM